MIKLYLCRLSPPAISRCRTSAPAASVTGSSWQPLWLWGVMVRLLLLCPMYHSMCTQIV
jgi:hypothetical protein